MENVFSFPFFDLLLEKCPCLEMNKNTMFFLYLKVFLGIEVLSGR